MRLYHLIYQSQALTAFTQPELVELLRKSWTCNLEHHVTGMLLHAPNGQFLQVLEGEEAAVHHLYYNRIAPDPRHEHLIVLSEGPSSTQVFADWCMSFRASPGLPALPGYYAPTALYLRVSNLTRATPELKRLLLDFAMGYDDSALCESMIGSRR
ncbi:BLUF domain-containing protein [Hymenobacter antarcticus]|uniref:BLUF domain-containing protein n=1 Tax=Hymenobacter antarcticus TaxID=486270 RepID=A0ABP7PHW5_9BACT